MRNWCTFFTSEESKLELLEEFKKVRNSISDYESLIQEFQKQPSIEEISNDTKLYVELKIAGLVDSWTDFNATPKKVLYEMIALHAIRDEEGNSTSPGEHSILSALNRVFEEM